MSITEQEAFALADDLRHLADMVADNLTVAEEVAEQIRRRGSWDGSTRLLIPVNSNDDPIGAMREFVRTALDAKVSVEKVYDDTYGAVNLVFPGGLTLYVYATRDQVCERVVTGTREVSEEVPDPEALKAVPKVEVTKVVEDVEWICKPLMADEPVSA